jgi:hypothetical protein
MMLTAADTDYSVELLREEHLVAICDLQDSVLSALGDPDLYVRKDEETDVLMRYLACPDLGQIVGILHARKLAAYGVISYPRAAAVPQLIQSFPGDKTNPMRCAVMEGAMVLPEHRCNGLQKTLLKLRKMLAASMGRTDIFAECAPANWISRHNLFVTGFSIAAFVENSDGRKRHLMTSIQSKDLVSMESQAQGVLVDEYDFEAQRRLLAESYFGVAASHRPTHDIFYTQTLSRPDCHKGSHARQRG